LNLTCLPQHHHHAEISNLRSDHFGSSLTALTHLAIAGCQLARLPPRSFVGLAALTHLSIGAPHTNTNNADLPTNSGLDLDYEAFVGLDRVIWLRLAANRIRRLPVRLLCPLPGLLELDLSHNGLTDLEDLGLRSSRGQQHQLMEEGGDVISSDVIDDDACAVLPLQRLNLSFNTIQALTPGIFWKSIVQPNPFVFSQPNSQVLQGCQKSSFFKK
jgi:Leucine-rich repeat (LRR) protein